ncbi:MAG: outer membrane protein assembly factor BamD [Nitrospirae bacterium]|nr:outer membrane protein assembly factor BamD [Candidatus Troglogloeales bacterium]
MESKELKIAIKGQRALRMIAHCRLVLLVMTGSFFILGCTTNLSGKSELLTLSHTDEAIVDLADQETATIYDPLSLLKRGEAYWVKEDYVSAASEYRRFVELFPSHRMAPFAQYSLAQSYAHQISTTDRDPTPIENALVSFNKVLTKYPDSLYTEEAAKKVKALKNQQAEYQFRIGYFYYKQEAYPAAIARFDNLLKMELQGDVTEKTLYYIGIAHYRIGNREMAELAFQRLKSEYAASPYIHKIPL